MQPPRQRATQVELGSTDTLRAIILNFTAAVTTLLVMRFASLLVRDSQDQTAPAFIQMITTPLVWPFQFIPFFGSEIIVEARFVDMFMIPVVVVAGLFAAGVLTGWRESSGGSRRYSATRD